MLHLPFLRLSRARALYGAGLLSIMVAGGSAETEFYSYDSNASGLSFTHAPVLDSDNAAEVSDILTAQEGSPLSVRVRQELLSQGAELIFRTFKLSCVFGDFTGVDRVARTRALADQVLASGLGRKAFAGGFNIYPNNQNDPTRPASLVSSGAARFQVLPPASEFEDIRALSDKGKGRQVAMPALFPGSPDFRGPAAGNSGAPNIRSALFILPIQRLTLAALGVRGFSSPAEAGAKLFRIPGSPLPRARLVPLIMRFNNHGNASLDSDGNPGNGYAFVQNAATPANGQLLSRGDLQALALHTRFRAADTVILFDAASSVVGYSAAQHSDDVRTGWNVSETASEIIARKRFAFANLSNTIGDSGVETGDDNPRSTELSGAVWSGVYDRAGTKRKMVIVLSNLGSVQRVVDFPKIGGARLVIDEAAEDPDNATIMPGQHKLLNFRRQGKKWVFQDEIFIGLDNNRNGVGIGAANPPEN